MEKHPHILPLKGKRKKELYFHNTYITNPNKLLLVLI